MFCYARSELGAAEVYQIALVKCSRGEERRDHFEGYELHTFGSRNVAKSVSELSQVEGA